MARGRNYYCASTASRAPAADGSAGWTATQTTKDGGGVGRGPRPSPGTAYSIIGRVTAAMRDAGIDQSEIDGYLKRAMAGDYDNLLKVSMETVTVGSSPSVPRKPPVAGGRVSRYADFIVSTRKRAGQGRIRTRRSDKIWAEVFRLTLMVIQVPSKVLRFQTALPTRAGSD